MKIAVVGGGIFGSTTAWMLAKEGFDVTLFERKHDLFQCASGINQYRLHRGYHYPRSKDTIISCLEGERDFREVYGECVVDEPHEHYYGIAAEDSFLNAQQCFDVWKDCGLEFEEVKLPFVKDEAFEKIVKVKEAIFDHQKLKEICKERLGKYGVKVELNKEVKYDDLEDYDYIIIATYAFNNSLLEKYPSLQKDYQFELVEKLVFKLPKKYENISFVVQDGPFTCIDPLGTTGLTLMGNVVHAIHHRNIGKSPVCPEEYKHLLNNGIVKNPNPTNLDKFLDAAEVFFPGIKEEAEHVGSMFTFRTVLPNREHDDARPTIVEKIDNRIITLFSGKIPTCVNAARNVLSFVKDN